MSEIIYNYCRLNYDISVDDGPIMPIRFKGNDVIVEFDYYGIITLENFDIKQAVISTI